MKWVGDRFSELMAYSKDGSVFVFGDSYYEHMFVFKVSILVYLKCREKLITETKCDSSKNTKEMA